MALIKKNNVVITKQTEPEKRHKSKRKSLSTSISRNWTEQAIRCYNSNQNCAECSINAGNYSFVCQMPKVIKTLLKEVGTPKSTVKSKKLA